MSAMPAGITNPNDPDGDGDNDAAGSDQDANDPRLQVVMQFFAMGLSGHLGPQAQKLAQQMASAAAQQAGPGGPGGPAGAPAGPPPAAAQAGPPPRGLGKRY